MTDDKTTFPYADGEGRGSLRIGAHEYELSAASIELYHCGADEADWNLFARTDRARVDGAPMSASWFLFGTVEGGPFDAHDALEGASLRVAPDLEGWECAHELGSVRGDLLPGDDAVVTVTRVEGDTLYLELRSTFGFTEDWGEFEDVAVTLEVTATVVGFHQGRQPALRT